MNTVKLTPAAAAVQKQTNPVVHRAYSFLTVTKADEDTGILEGIATTPDTDRVGDIVEPKGAQFTLPIPFLWQHLSSQPIGQVIKATVTDKGIAVVVQIARGILPEIDRAWTLIKSGLVRGLSIGFRGIETADIKDSWGVRFIKWDWLELSAVTIPANAAAGITAVKSAYLEALSPSERAAVSGHQAQTGVVKLGGSATLPAVAGAVSKSTQPVTKGTAMSGTVKEQRQDFENKRAANVARMGDIMDAATKAGETLSAEASEEYDRLASEIEVIDKHLDRLRKLEALQEKETIAQRERGEQVNRTATAVSVTDGMQEGSARQRVAAGEMVLRANSNLPPGMGLARYVKALAFAKGNNAEAQGYAKQWEDSTPEVLMALKAAVAAGTTTDSAWAGPLVYNTHLASEFVEYLRPQLIIGKMSGFRRVPFNVRFPTQTGGSTVGWVGEGAAKPVSKLQFSSGSLGFAKAAGIVIITQELARFSSPSAELLVRDDLASQMQYFLDQQFIDPGVAAVANTNPASVLNGASNVRQAAATWNTAANIETDVKALLQTFADNEIPMDGSMYWVMTPSTALALSMIRTTGGENFAYPGLTINGGTFFGIPVITSNSVPHSVSAGAIVALVKANDIFLADDGQIAIDVSQEASLQMDSAPSQTSATPTASTVVSMFQTNSLAIRCERIINWARRRTYAVGYIDNMHTS